MKFPNTHRVFKQRSLTIAVSEMEGQTHNHQKPLRTEKEVWKYLCACKTEFSTESYNNRKGNLSEKPSPAHR